MKPPWWKVLLKVGALVCEVVVLTIVVLRNRTEPGIWNQPIVPAAFAPLLTLVDLIAELLRGNGNGWDFVILSVGLLLAFYELGSALAAIAIGVTISASLISLTYFLGLIYHLVRRPRAGAEGGRPAGMGGAPGP